MFFNKKKLRALQQDVDELGGRVGVIPMGEMGKLRSSIMRAEGDVRTTSKQLGMLLDYLGLEVSYVPPQTIITPKKGDE